MSSEPASGVTDKPEQSAGRLELRMAADRTALATVTTPISEKLEQLHVAEEKQYEILLALQEALANAVVHGCKGDASKEVLCQLEWHSDGSILIVVIDPGAGFAFEEIAHPLHPDNFYSDHGRGVYLIRELMDKVSFHNNGNEIRMWKY